MDNKTTGIKTTGASDYKGVDANNDGYGDTPYNIIGSANAKDNTPLIQAIPEFPNPLILLLTTTLLGITMTTLKKRLKLNNRPLNQNDLKHH